MSTWQRAVAPMMLTRHAPRCPAPIAVSISNCSSCTVAPATDINIHKSAVLIGRLRPSLGTYAGAESGAGVAIVVQSLIGDFRLLASQTDTGSHRVRGRKYALLLEVFGDKRIKTQQRFWCSVGANPHYRCILRRFINRQDTAQSITKHRQKSCRARVFDRSFNACRASALKPETMMFGLHETMQSRMHSSLKEEPSLLTPGVGAGASAGVMPHLMHHHHHHHHVASVRNWMQPTVVDQAAALARYHIHRIITCFIG